MFKNTHITLFISEYTANFLKKLDTSEIIAMDS